MKKLNHTKTVPKVTSVLSSMVCMCKKKIMHFKMASILTEKSYS